MKNIFFAVCLAFATPVAAAEVRVDASFINFGARFQDNATVTIAAAQKNVGGKLAICGVYWTDGGSPRYMREIGPAYVKQLRFSLGNTTLPKKNWQFKKIRNGSDANGQAARCNVLNMKWSDQMTRMPLRSLETQGVIRG